MTKALATVDANVLEKLGITADQAQELVENGISIEEYAQMVGADLASEAGNVQAQAVRWKIVHAGTAFKNEATGDMKQKLVGIIPFFHIQRALFMTDGQERPDCSSNDGKVGTYEEEGEMKSRECAGCPWNAYGSDPKGGKGKGCKEMRRLFLLEEGHEVPSVLTIPPTSLGVFDKFVSGMLYENKPIAGVQVELTLESKKEGSQEWSVLKTPTVLRKLSPLEYVKVSRMREGLEASAKRAQLTREEAVGALTSGESAGGDDEI